jgi:nucleotide-binding universal stress UspA family protein
MHDRILLPTDGGEGVRRAVEHAIETATRDDAELHVLYVVDSEVVNAYAGGEEIHEFEGVEQTLEDEGLEAVSAVADRAADAGVETVTAVVRGTPHEEILRYVDEADVDLVVMGSTQQSDAHRRMLGSVTERVSRLASVPVSIVKTPVEE